MGLDMFAYTRDQNNNEEQLYYWRKHPNLHGWMQQLWVERGMPMPESKDTDASEWADDPGPCFNCIAIELDESDISRLELDVLNARLPETVGFFFGQSSHEDREGDLEFIKLARKALGEGKKVYYDSWW